MVGNFSIVNLIMVLQMITMIIDDTDNVAIDDNVAIEDNCNI